MTTSRLFAGTPYPYGLNSLNMFRLILAGLVLFAHAWYIAGQGTGPSIQGENLGGWAVAGFFVLSGFLITRSRLRTKPGEFLLHRIARIFPAFIVILFVTAFVFAPIAQLVEQGSLEGFLTTGPTPFQYVWGNIALAINNYDIGVTLSSAPYPGAWNGSLWTLYYEFLCYIVVWLLGGLAVFRRSPVFVGACFVFSVAVYAAIGLAGRLGLDPSFALFARLLPYFLGGSLIYFIVEKYGMNRVFALLSLLAAVALIAFVPRWGGQASAPFLAYGLLYLSSVITQPRWIAKNDVSYGFYIYAWPIQQLAVLFGAATLGMPAYIAITVVLTLGAAWLSWVLVERPMMGLARGTSAQLRPRSLVTQAEPRDA
ncbi:MAG: acyltransferase [Microbacteriaceae bacterium]